MHEYDQIPIDRILSAADAIAQGLEDIHEIGFDGRPSDLLGRDEQPWQFREFTRDEIVAAERFLARCGFLDHLAAA